MTDNSLPSAAQLKGEASNSQEAASLRRSAAKDMSLISVIPKWGGTDSVVPLAEFFELIEGTARIGSWTEADKIQVCMLRLTDSAREFYRATPELRDPKITWAEVKELFAKRFRDVRTDQFHFAQLHQVKQRKNESPSNFLDRCKILARRTVPSVADATMQRAHNEQAERMLLAAYCAGLAGTVGREVRLRAPVTVDQAVQIAVSVEQAELFERRDNSFFMDAQAEKTQAVRASQSSAGRRKSRQRVTYPHPSPQVNSRDANERRPMEKVRASASPRCYECSGYGHYASDCANRRLRESGKKAEHKGDNAKAGSKTHNQGEKRRPNKPAEN